jgi:CheY-like chemotaxis protein
MICTLINVDKIEAVSSSPISNEEKDYVFLNKLEVLYIDNDISSQKIINNYASDTTHITACDSIYSAFDIVESKKYDIILCDMTTASKDILKEFFNVFSQNIPIIAMSTTIDAKIAYMSAKMGAKDYIVKNTKDFKAISKSIHKVYLEHVKEKEKKNSLQLLNDSDTRIVLRDLINTELPIEQRLNTTFENNIPIDDAIKKNYSIQANDILSKNQKIIKSLLKMEFLVKEYLEQTVACPNCTSVNVFIHYFCDNCKNSNFKRQDILVHKECDQVSHNKKIEHNNKLLCPFCNNFYENNSINFYVKSGYQCNICNCTFSNPSSLYGCNICNLENFSINDAKWIGLFKYKINHQEITKIKNDLFFLNDLEKYLVDKGHSVKQFEKLLNGEQSLGPFEMLSYKDNYTFIFIMLNRDLQSNLNRIFEIDFALKFIDNEVKAFAISLLEPQEIVLKLLKKFNIIPLVKENINEITKEIEKFI